MKICLILVPPPVPPFFQDAGCVHASVEWTPMSDIVLVYIYIYIGLNHELRHQRGEILVTSDVQLVNYTNIRSEGTDSR